MIYLDKELVVDLPAHSTMVYMAIRMMMRNDQESDYYTAGRLCYALGLPFDKYWSEELKYGIIHMMNKGLINATAHDGYSHGHVFDISKLQLDIKSRYYIMIPEEDIKCIGRSGLSNRMKKELYKYYLIIFSTFNHSKDLGEYAGKVGTMTISYLADLSGISERTAQRYNEALEQLGLLYVRRSSDFIKKYDGLSQISNVYSRLEDKNICDRYAEEYESNYGYNTTKVKSNKTKKQADKNRSLAQMYNQMLKGKVYDDRTTDEIRRYIENKNKFAEEELNFFLEIGSSEELINDLKSKIRDVSVFEQQV